MGIQRTIPISTMPEGTPPERDWLVPAISYDSVAKIYRPHRVTVDSLRGPKSVAELFSLVGDNATLNDTQLAAAIAYCVANNVALIPPKGKYRHQFPINWGFSGLTVLALESGVEFVHVGSGVAHNFNGMLNYPASQGCINAVFGGPCAIKLSGNQNATSTDGVHIDNWHGGYMNVELHDFATPFISVNTGIVGSAAVESFFKIRAITHNYLAPGRGVDADTLYDCIFEDPRIEGCGSGGNPAFVLHGCVRCELHGGAVQGNFNGGIFDGATSAKNRFLGVDCEVNGAGRDWTLSSTAPVLINCGASGTTIGSIFNSAGATLIGCGFQSLTNNDNTLHSVNTQFNVAFIDNGLFSTVINPYGAAAPAGYDRSTTVLYNKSFNTDNANILKVASNTINTISGSGSAVLLATKPVVLSANDNAYSLAINSIAGSIDASIAFQKNGVSFWKLGTHTGDLTENFSLYCSNTGGTAWQADKTTFVVNFPQGITHTKTNNVVITPPAAQATFTLGSGKTIALSNSMTQTATDGSTVAFGAGGTVLYTASIDTDALLAANSAVLVPSQSAVKSYVDNAVTGLFWKPAVDVATTANIVLSGEQTVDGALTNLFRVLVKNQATASQNGIYLSAAGAWARVADMDTAAEFPSATVFVKSGTINSDTQWTCTNNAVVVGTTSVAFAQVAGAGTYSAGAGLALAGNQFSVDSATAAAFSATKLATARNIDGQSFDGTANITVIAPGTHAAASKATPVDADELPLVDSAAGNILARLTWANLKATLKSYFDPLYATPMGMLQSSVVGVNFAVAGDKPITFTLPPGMTRFTLFRIQIGHASASLATATFGLFTAVGGGGVALIAGGTACTVSTAADNTSGNVQVVGLALSAEQLASALAPANTVQLRIGATAAGTADVTIYYFAAP